jgi:hypothetical protein
VTTRPRNEVGLNAIDRSGVRLAVQFKWLDDRYGHTVTVDRRGSRMPLLESLEGSSGNDWPSSPPIQEISDCTIESDSNRGEVILFVGAAGRSHWAMTLTIRDHWIDHAARVYQSEIFFDVACRVSDRPAWLGTSYRVLCGQVAVSEKLRQARVPADAPNCLIIGENADVKLDTSTGPYPIIRCEAPTTSREVLPDTVRWRYAIRLCTESVRSASLVL